MFHYHQELLGVFGKERVFRTKINSPSKRLPGELLVFHNGLEVESPTVCNM